MPRYDAEWIAMMLQPELREAPPAEETLGQIGVSPGQTIADIGCGPGFFTVPAAIAVGPTGRVYAIDVAANLLDLVRTRAAAAGLANVETRQSPGLPIPLDDASADVTICGLVLHDLADPAPLVHELSRVTRPDGLIAVVEWTPALADPRRNRMTPERTARLLSAAGRTPA